MGRGKIRNWNLSMENCYIVGMWQDFDSRGDDTLGWSGLSSYPYRAVEIAFFWSSIFRNRWEWLPGLVLPGPGLRHSQDGVLRALLLSAGSQVQVEYWFFKKNSNWRFFRPNDSRMIVPLGEIYKRLGRPADAEKCFAAAYIIGDVEGNAAWNLAT